jgi:uncharacterized protein YkwD
MRRTPAFVGWLAVVVAMLFPGVASASAERDALGALNQIRNAHGLPALRHSAALAESAGRYARRMLRREYFGHAASIPVASRFSAAGETLAWHVGHAPRARRTVILWMTSPPHRAALLSRRFRLVGMGMEHGWLAGRPATVWVAHLGRL